MKRCAWLLLSLVALLLSGSTMSPAPPQTEPVPAVVPYAAREGMALVAAAEVFASPAGRCWSTSQPHHWHACLLQQP